MTDGAAAVQALLDALRRIAARGEAHASRRDRTVALRGPTFDAVDALKREGLSATDVLKAIAELAAYAEIPSAEETLDDMSAWCVQRYFSREQLSP